MMLTALLSSCYVLYKSSLAELVQGPGHPGLDSLMPSKHPARQRRGNRSPHCQQQSPFTHTGFSSSNCSRATAETGSGCCPSCLGTTALGILAAEGSITSSNATQVPSTVTHWKEIMPLWVHGQRLYSWHPSTAHSPISAHAALVYICLCRVVSYLSRTQPLLDTFCTSLYRRQRTDIENHSVHGAKGSSSMKLLAWLAHGWQHHERDAWSNGSVPADCTIPQSLPQWSESRVCSPRSPASHLHCWSSVLPSSQLPSWRWHVLQFSPSSGHC